jgi:uncharacterized membrane protein YdjX (TVP38/TMEM64 family)
MSNRIKSVFRQIGPGLVIRGGLLMTILIAAGYFINKYQFSGLLGMFDISENPDTNWLNARLSFFALAAVFTAFGGPRQAVSFFSAYFFGLYAGFAVAIASTLAGCLLALAIAAMSGGVAQAIMRGRVNIAIQVWAANPFAMTLALRLMPIGSNLITNLAAGVARIPLSGFIAGTALGYVPQTLVFSLMGAGVNIGSEMQVALSIVLFVVSVIVGIWIYARYRKSIKTRIMEKNHASTISPDLKT